jgi:hypothetical protein
MYTSVNTDNLYLSQAMYLQIKHYVNNVTPQATPLLNVWVADTTIEKLNCAVVVVHTSSNLSISSIYVYVILIYLCS